MEDFQIIELSVVAGKQNFTNGSPLYGIEEAIDDSSFSKYDFRLAVDTDVLNSKAQAL
jgi:hypothetical protein